MADGDYYRLLHNGSYEVTVSAEGYYPATQCVRVENIMNVDSHEAREAEEVDFVLTPTSEDRPKEDAASSAHCQALSHKARGLSMEENEVDDVAVEEEVVGQVRKGGCVFRLLCEGWKINGMGVLCFAF